MKEPAPINEKQIPYLIPTEKVKRSGDYPCSVCKKEIELGTSYMSVFFNDGFMKKPYGAFHTECWIKFTSNGK